MPSIGIDLGTTNSCVAVFQNGKVNVIRNKHGENTTPSYLAFTETGRLFGNDAKNQSTINPSNTIFDAKRLIGRQYQDTIVQNDIIKWPFKVVDAQGKPAIEVQYKNETKKLLVEEISAAILYTLKEIAEDFLGKEVIKAVITVPAYFNDAQRKSTQVAGQIAGLDVIRIINEPTAAALAYGFDSKNNNKSDGELRLLIFDLGGGTFDVSILVMEDGVLEVKSTSGDTHLGGEDFTGRMVDYFAKEIQTKHDYNINQDKKAMSRLTKECETAKKLLSISKNEKIVIDSLFNGKDFNTTITKEKFEKLNEDLFLKTMDTVRETLKDAKMEPKDIDDIVLVGGSTRIPKVQAMLRDFFGGKELKKRINPDEAVAVGAAIQAARLDGVETKDLQDTILIDVAPLSLGIETTGGRMNVIITRNTPIPTRATKHYTTTYDNQTEVNVVVFEGERLFTKDNNELGQFTLDDLEPQQRGKPSIDVTFEIDCDGILKVTAVEKSENKEKNIEIKNEKGRLPKEEIERMIAEAERYSHDDKKEKVRIEGRLKLESLCLKVKSDLTLGKLKDSISDGGKEKLHAVCDEALAWLSLHQYSTNEETQSKTKTVNKAYDVFVPH